MNHKKRQKNMEKKCTIVDAIHEKGTKNHIRMTSINMGVDQ